MLKNLFKAVMGIFGDKEVETEEERKLRELKEIWELYKEFYDFCVAMGYPAAKAEGYLNWMIKLEYEYASYGGNIKELA